MKWILFFALMSPAYAGQELRIYCEGDICAMPKADIQALVTEFVRLKSLVGKHCT